jgi:hypothetical protein
MLILNSINTDTPYHKHRHQVRSIPLTQSNQYSAIMHHFSDCDGSAIFGISSINLSIWTNSYQHRMEFDLFTACSKFWHTWVGETSLKSGVLSTIIITTTTTIVTTTITFTTSTTTQPTMYSDGSKQHPLTTPRFAGKFVDVRQAFALQIMGQKWIELLRLHMWVVPVGESVWRTTAAYIGAHWVVKIDNQAVRRSLRAEGYHYLWHVRSFGVDGTHLQGVECNAFYKHKALLCRRAPLEKRVQFLNPLGATARFWIFGALHFTTVQVDKLNATQNKMLLKTARVQNAEQRAARGLLCKEASVHKRSLRSPNGLNSMSGNCFRGLVILLGYARAESVTGFWGSRISSASKAFLCPVGLRSMLGSSMFGVQKDLRFSVGERQHGIGSHLKLLLGISGRMKSLYGGNWKSITILFWSTTDVRPISGACPCAYPSFQLPSVRRYTRRR